MKGRCVALLSADGKPVEFSPWLTLGNVYHVLGILMDKHGNKWFRILANERDSGVESLGLYQAECFEVITDYRPSTWRDREIKGIVETSPAAWQTGEFWENLYEGDPEALCIFERERKQIISEESQ